MIVGLLLILVGTPYAMALDQGVVPEKDIPFVEAEFLILWVSGLILTGWAGFSKKQH